MTQLLTEIEASELLRLTPRQVLRLAKRGEMPSVILPDGEIRFDGADISRWIDARKQPAHAIAASRSPAPGEASR